MLNNKMSGAIMVPDIFLFGEYYLPIKTITPFKIVAIEKIIIEHIPIIDKSGCILTKSPTTGTFRSANPAKIHPKYKKIPRSMIFHPFASLCSSIHYMYEL